MVTEFRILGPLDVRDAAGPVTVGGGKPRAVLAVLLLHANEPVSADRLALALWGEDAPHGAVKTVQVHVSRLRKALGRPDIITTTPAGYRLRVEPGELDAERFRDLVEDGRRALADGHAERAASVLRDALDIWRGPPLADLESEPFAHAEIARLEEQRLAALEARLEADLAAGRHAEIVGELQLLVETHPTRERFAAHLMVALYRCGRQAEALEAYRTARAGLVAEIGAEPKAELRALHEAILRQDPALEADTAPPSLPPELDAAAAPPLVAREAELAWLRERWSRARAGAGAVVTLIGPPGIGKRRLAAELAGEAHRSGATVLSVQGSHAPAGVIRSVAAGVRPTLLVLHGADALGSEALADLERAVEGAPLLVLATAHDADAVARLGRHGCLALEPLPPGAVEAVAATYAPRNPDVRPPVEWLAEASGGIPGLVHALASQWARREAARRVEVVAQRAAAGRTQLRSLEGELASGVVALEEARDRVAVAGNGDHPVVCPFKGLAPFERADARYFFGRERLIAEIVARVVGAPLLGVVGPSGSGKSSVLRAGVLPALAGGVLPGSDEWPYVLVRPGERPVDTLDAAVAEVDEGSHAVLAVDQFEEAFTACRVPAHRAEFMARIVDLALHRPAGCTVILAVRADFYGACGEYPQLSGLLAANNVLVGPMQRDELRRAIERPAERAGLRVEAELTDVLVADVEDQPGSLPLLSTALLELWQRRDGRHLRHSAYERTGGVSGAVARLAEEAFGRLDPSEHGEARDLLVRLVQEESDGGVERRRVPLGEVQAWHSETVDRVVATFTQRRLLTVTAGTVELVHEALLREWPRLCGWIEEERESLRLRRRLTAAAEEWLTLDRDAESLWRGTRLAEAREWCARRDPHLTDLEREFLDASTDRRRREQGARRRRLAAAFGSLLLALAIIGVVAVVALEQRHTAIEQERLTDSRRLAARSAIVREGDPALSVGLALRAFHTSGTAEAEAALREATLAHRQLAAVRADPEAARAVAFSPDGGRAVSGGEDGSVRVWDVATRDEVARLDGRHGSVLVARYTSAGAHIAIGYEDGTVALTDSTLRDRTRLLHVPRHAAATPTTMALSADGERVAAVFDDGSVRVAGTAGGGNVPPVDVDAGWGIGAAVSPDGRQVVTASVDGSVRLWDAVTGQRLRHLQAGDDAQTVAAFSPDGRRVLAGGDDGIVRLWSVKSGELLRRFTGEGRELLAAAFSRDGRRVAAGGRDGVIRVWNVSGGPAVAELRGHRGFVYGVGFGAAADRLISAGDDGTVRTWDAGRTSSWTGRYRTSGIELSQSGGLVAAASTDGTVTVRDAATGRLRGHLSGPPGFTDARFSPDGDALLVTGETPAIRLWRLADDAVRTVARLPRDRGVSGATFDRTGERIAYSDDGTGVYVRGLASGREIALRGARSRVYDAVFSPDGVHVATITEAGAVLIWDVNRPARPQRVLRGHDGHINALAYSPDGRRLITAGSDRTARVWNARGGPAMVLRGHEDEVTTAVFAPDGQRVLSSSADGTVRLWDPTQADVSARLQTGESLLDITVGRDWRIGTLTFTDTVQVFRCEVCGAPARVRALADARLGAPAGVG